jgi:hypothetical protein
VSEERWDEILRLQRWYNSEFSWSSGRLVFRRYVLFVNAEEFADLEWSPNEIVERRKASLRQMGMGELEIVAQLERDGLVSVRWGGYQDDSYASGFTRVADNEWNAYLVCEFLLKASLAIPDVAIVARDEGQFIKTGMVRFRNGCVEVPSPAGPSERGGAATPSQRVFALIDPDRYADHKAPKNVIPQFTDRKPEERKKLVQNWNWLGFGNAEREFDEPKDGLDLNSKVKKFVAMAGE